MLNLRKSFFLTRVRTCHCSSCWESSTFCWMVSNSWLLTCINSMRTLANSISTAFLRAIVSSRIFQARFTISSLDNWLVMLLMSSFSILFSSFNIASSLSKIVTVALSLITSLFNFWTLSLQPWFSLRIRSSSPLSVLNSWQVIHC